MKNLIHFSFLALLVFFAQASYGQCDAISEFTLLGEHEGHGYYLSNTSATWTQAKTLAENAGGYLASMNDQAENDFLKSKLNNNMVFIGYNDATTEGAGQWANGDPVSLDLSYGNSESNDFAVMNFWAGTWQMEQAGPWRKFIMEKGCGSGGNNTDFITTWKTNIVNTQITIPTFNGAAYDYTVDWGDGQTSNHITGDAVHQYSVAGTYQVAISGLFPRIYLSKFDWLNYQSFLSIDQWGDNPWTSMEGAFDGAYTMEILAMDLPDLSNVTSMKRMLVKVKKCSSSISNWDVSHVTNMEGLFEQSKFSQDISGWDVSHVVNMRSMFKQSHFNNNIGNWNVSQVTNMAEMFSSDYTFNQGISNWDVSHVTDMSGMFEYVSFFNGSINNWDVGNVTNMARMFKRAVSFNKPLNSWDVSHVTNMEKMFNVAWEFNQDLNSWDVGNVTDMGEMFYEALKFNGKIGAWDVSKVTNLYQTFWKAKFFNQDISSWNTGQVTNMESMFFDCPEFNADLSNWNVSKVKNMSWMFRECLSFNQNIGSWDVGQVANMRFMFAGAKSFNQDISSWNTSQVINMESMFQYALSFEANIGSWDVQQVTNMDRMFLKDTLSTAIYDSILIGWSAQNLQSNVKFHAGNSTYCEGISARAKLKNDFGWTITDVGPDPVCSGQSSCGDINGFTKLGELNGQGYYLSETSVSWSQAKTLAENAGGYLVTINNQEENNFIQSKLNNQMAFIGFSDVLSENAGQWANNEPVSLDLSYGNSVENDFAVINFWAGTWQMVNQWVQKSFIVEMECSAPVDVTCLATGQTFETQEDVDNFPVLHPGCTTILGNVRIGNFQYNNESTLITNLNGFSMVKEIIGDLIIKKNANLLSLNGLHNLKKVGKNLSISGQSIEDLALNELIEVNEKFTIINCDSLKDLEGLNKLKNINKDFKVTNCSALKNLQGLNQLSYIGGDFFLGGGKSSYYYYLFQGGNHQLTSLSGLESLDSVGGDFVLMDNPQLVNLVGPSQLTKVDNLVIGGCSLLQNFQGLESLRSVKSLELNPVKLSYYNGNGQAFSKSNDNFYDFSGLENLENIESIVVGTNPNLNSFNGLPTITTLTNLIVAHNTSLHDFQGLNQLTEVKSNLIVGWGSNQSGQYSHFVIPAGSAINSFSGLENLTKVNNFLVGYSESLTNFVGLENLQTIEGNFRVGAYNRACMSAYSPDAEMYFYDNTNLTSFEGLSSLTFVGASFQLIGHNLIKDFTHLGALQSVGYLKVNSSELISLNGLLSLNSIKHDITLGGYESLAGKLADISLLSFVDTIHGDLSLNKVGMLSTLQGLENLKQVDKSVTIIGMSKLTNLDALASLEHIGGAFILGKHSRIGLFCDSRFGNVWEDKYDYNPKLASIDGLGQLKTIGHSFGFEGNSLITSLSPMSSLESINSNLFIAKNSSLTDIGVFNNVTIGGDVDIINNNQLASCNNTWLCDLIATTPNKVYITNNAEGCNSILEIDCNSTPTTCDEVVGFTKLGEYNGHGYYLSNDTKPWLEAKTLAENEGGYLATMNTQAENDFLKSKLSNNMVFIGFNDATSEGSGQWANGESVSLDLSYSNSNINDFAVMNFWAGTWQMEQAGPWRKYIMEVDCGVGQPALNSNLAHATIQSVYPNPANDIIGLHVNSDRDKESFFNIYDGRGQLLLSENRFLPQGTSSVEFEINELPAGMYFVKEAGAVQYYNFVILR